MKQIASHESSISRIRTRVGNAILVFCLLAFLVAFPKSVSGQTTSQLDARPNQLKRQTPTALRGTVKIVVLDGGIQIIGSRKDIESVKQAIAIITHQLNTKTTPPISERVKLRFQLADTVVPLLNNAMGFSGNGSNLQISALHFPESLLLVGPASEVQRAKKYLQTIDSHKAFPNPKTLQRPKLPSQRH